MIKIDADNCIIEFSNITNHVTQRWTCEENIFKNKNKSWKFIMFVWYSYKYEFISYEHNEVIQKLNYETSIVIDNYDTLFPKAYRKSLNIHYQDIDTTNSKFDINGNKFYADSTSIEQLLLSHNPIRTGIHRVRFRSINDSDGRAFIGISDGYQEQKEYNNIIGHSANG